ncbi:recombinase [Gracilibacillus halophilus YIM-C55.5]|uniref:Recombinase n=1 Tax=Gracilibacillus halophilus YIM-C55.5 TaxID=1308866 RepID=N4W8I5_9BACI|nr:zinc ribbon domain-containing protein [Gracilibacillus halophilus]ENH95524.1 recombinase [Gracilibacillus halophilus YIM-C55.5]
MTDTHLFTNHMYCSDCGKGMWYRQNRHGYICGFYAKHGTIACTNHAIKEQDLKNVILRRIKNMAEFIHEQGLESKLRNLDQRHAEHSQEELQEINEKLAGHLEKSVSTFIY